MRPAECFATWRCFVLLAAVEATQLSLVEYQKRPFCNPSSPVPPVKGNMSQDNLILDAGCRYAPFERSGATACLGGTWMVIMGSSNTLLEFNNLINFLAPDEYFIDRTGELIGVSAVVDAMIQRGKVIHWKGINAREADCEQLNLAKAEALRSNCGALMAQLFAEAPNHGPDVVRITFITTFFWYRASLALDIITADAKWQKAKVAVVAQVGAWYMYCMIIKFKYCPRKELIPVDFYKKGVQIYAKEMKDALNKLESFCKGGRAMGCAVQTISWSNGARDKKAYEALNVPLKQHMLSRATAQFRLVDFFALGGVMPKEVVEGHGSQLLNLWMWTVMFNGFCPAELGSLKPVARFTGTMCTAAKLSYSKCPQYHKLCTYNTKHFGGPACMNWACLNSVPCNLSTHDAPVHLKQEGGICEMNLSSLAASSPRRQAASPQWQWLLPVLLLAVGCKVLILLLHSSRSATIVALTGEAEPLASRDAVTTSSQSPPRDLTSVPSAKNRGIVLGLALFLASTHVALSEAFTWGRVPAWEFYGWGEMWVPFLILVSGFLLGDNSMSKDDGHPVTHGIVDDLRVFYPLYALGLLLTFACAKLAGTHLDVATLVAQAFLVQTWLPGEDLLLPECRWLSCLALYFLCFGTCRKAMGVQRLDLPSTIWLMSFLLLLPWFIIFFRSAAHTEFTDLTLNLGGGLRAEHPLSYLHVFLLGILLAQLRRLLDPLAAQGGVAWQNPYMATLQLATPLGFLGLLLVQCFQVVQLGEDETFAVCKPLLFFQLLILVGLVGLPSLPLSYVAYVFSYADFLEEYWWPLLVTSPCILAVWPGENHPVHAVLLLLLLFATSFLVTGCIQKPLHRCWTSSSLVMVVLPLLVAGVLVAGALLPSPVSQAQHHDPSARDVLLATGVAKPAMLVTQHEVMLVAQKQYGTTWSRRCGVHQDADGQVHQAVILEKTVHGELVVGHQPLPSEASALKAFDVQPWPGSGASSRQLCVSERWFPANRTLLRRIALGPESAKPLSATALVVESMPPKGSGCPRRDVRATQMYLSVARAPAQRLDYGFVNAEEKNWIPFMYKGSLHFVDPPVPHVIVKADTASGRSQRLWQSQFLPLQRLQRNDVEFQGSGQAVFVEGASRPHYLALLHAVNRSDSAGTAYYAYRFAAEPPFEMLQVSSPLPLPLDARPSGLALLRQELLLSYTDSQEESRALVMSLRDLDQLFGCREAFDGP